ncbi:MAG: hypothetical protein HC923_08320 [Myxococcales bacterium]|nr:hypothetical protein [Myxococcales bacterium]
MAELEDASSGAGETAPNSATAEVSKVNVLQKYGRDLTELAAKGKLDPVSGRDPEIREMTTILLRQSKSNPLIVGPPGTGKTALVEGLALRIASGDVPDRLKDCAASSSSASLRCSRAQSIEASSRSASRESSRRSRQGTG